MTPTDPPFDDSNVDDPRATENAAEEHGDSDEEFDADHDVTNPSNTPAEQEVNDRLGGNFPLR